LIAQWWAELAQSLQEMKSIPGVLAAPPANRAQHRARTKCPEGHELKAWTARAGACDGCHRVIQHGEQVMDCRACNWYLCKDCRPCSNEHLATIWGAVQSLFFGGVCHAPTCGGDGLRHEEIRVAMTPDRKDPYNATEEQMGMVQQLKGNFRSPPSSPPQAQASLVEPQEMPQEEVEADEEGDEDCSPMADGEDSQAQVADLLDFGAAPAPAAVAAEEAPEAVAGRSKEVEGEATRPVMHVAMFGGA